MDKPFSRKLLVLELIRRGVLPGYAWRVTGELADHADDIATTGADSTAGLGDIDLLATQIVESYRRRTFAGRHPFLAFVAAPFPLALTAYCTFWFVGVLLIVACSKLTSFASLCLLLFHVGSMCVPSTVVTALICRLTRQAGLSWKKTLVACSPVLFVAAVLFSYVALDSLEHGFFMIGICPPGVSRRIFFPNWSVPLMHRIGQFGLPVCAIFWMYLRERARVRNILMTVAECDNRTPDVDSSTSNIAEAARFEQKVAETFSVSAKFVSAPIKGWC